MRISAHKNRRQKHRRRRLALRTALLMAISAALLAALLFGLRNCSSPSLLADTARHGWPTMTALDLTPGFRGGRNVFPYSIVPGGLRNVREVQDSIAADSLVALHYRGLNLENLVLRRTSAAMDVFVSYRVQNAIYWTSYKIHMAKGEIVLADGAQIIRARCGNRIIFELPPEAPTEPTREPPPVVFEHGLPPVVSPDEPLLLETGAEPEPPPAYGPPLFAPPVACCGGYAPVIAGAATPEPSTLLLVGAGILIVGLRLKGKTRQ